MFVSIDDEDDPKNGEKSPLRLYGQRLDSAENHLGYENEQQTYKFQKLNYRARFKRCYDLYGRWFQLTSATFAMILIANLQYSWTLFVDPIRDKYAWNRSAIQVTFTIFTLTQTWLSPFEGYVIDRYGPKLTVFIAGLLAGLSWILNSFADSLLLFYIAGALGGIGAGMVYSGALSTALKWFPDRRGLASGLISAGYGAGSALTVIPIAKVIDSDGFAVAFRWFGVGIAIIVPILSLVLRNPLPHEVEMFDQVAEVDQQDRKQYHLAEVIRTRIFWIMYLIFVLVATGGLVLSAELGPIGDDVDLSKRQVTLLGIRLEALTFAVSIGRVLNGLTRPIFGYLSDRAGRERVMGIAFICEGLLFVFFWNYGLDDAMAFVLLSSFIFFAWGEIYSVFPALTTDLYGRTNAAANYGLVYTAKGSASLAIPLVALLQENTGWDVVLITCGVMNLLAAIIAYFILPQMKTKFLSYAVADTLPRLRVDNPESVRVDEADPADFRYGETYEDDDEDDRRSRLSIIR